MCERNHTEISPPEIGILHKIYYVKQFLNNELESKGYYDIKDYMMHCKEKCDSIELLINIIKWREQEVGERKKYAKPLGIDYIYCKHCIYFTSNDNKGIRYMKKHNESIRHKNNEKQNAGVELTENELHLFVFATTCNQGRKRKCEIIKKIKNKEKIFDYTKDDCIASYLYERTMKDPIYEIEKYISENRTKYEKYIFIYRSLIVSRNTSMV